MVIPIPMQMHIHGDSIPAEMRRGRLGHGAAQGAGRALAPASARGDPADLQPIPMEMSMDIPTVDPMGMPCGLWISPMDTPVEICAEVPLRMGIPMEVRFPRGCPWRTRRGRLGHGAAQGAGPALAPSSPRGNLADVQPNPKGIHVEILIPMGMSIGTLVDITVVCACVGGCGGGEWWWWWCVCVCIVKEMYVYRAS